MGLLDFIINQGVKTGINGIRQRARRIQRQGEYNRSGRGDRSAIMLASRLHNVPLKGRMYGDNIPLTNWTWGGNGNPRSAFVMDLEDTGEEGWNEGSTYRSTATIPQSQESDFIKSERERLAKKQSAKPKDVASKSPAPRTTVRTNPNLTSFGGIQKGWRNTGQFDTSNNNLTSQQKMWLDSKGIDFSNAKALQQGINKYFISAGISDRIAEDGKWGSQSQNALNKILNDNNSDISNFTQDLSGTTSNTEVDLPPTRREGTDAGTFTTTPQPDYMRFVNPVMPYVQNYYSGVYDNTTYNKRDTKQWLRDRGVNTRGLGRRTIKTWRDMLNNKDPWVGKFNVISLSKKGSKLIKIQSPIIKFKYKNGGNLNRIPGIGLFRKK